MYAIKFTKSAKKSFSKITTREQKRIALAIEKLAQDPMIGKPLKGILKDLRSLRIGNYRVIYQVVKEKLLILVFAVGHRREVYLER